jgi:two-component system, LytTR family, response regulator
MNSLSALVVDDEPAARRDLVEVLGAVGNVHIVAQASDAAAARLLARRHRPELIFMDIQLPGADGFSALQEIDMARSCVIFTTAYAQFALRAFEFGATDYLLKPVEEDRCRRAIERARETLRRPLEADNGPLLEIEEHGRHVLIPAASVRLVTAEGNYLEITHDGGRGLVRRTLENLLAALPPDALLRINRNQAVRPSHVQSWNTSGPRGFRLLTRDGTELSVARRRTAEVRARLRHLAARSA